MEDWQREIIKEIARKLRHTALEFKHKDQPLKNALLIGNFNPDDWRFDYICGLEVVYAPTVSVYTLGNVSWHVARFFEDA